jgi:hypothetical protein
MGGYGQGGMFPQMWQQQQNLNPFLNLQQRNY